MRRYYYDPLRNALPLRDTIKQNCFDYELYDEKDIQMYLNEDENNRVFTLLHPNGKEEVICTTLQQIENKKGYNDQIFFECNAYLRRNGRNAFRYAFTQINFPSINIIVPYFMLYERCPEYGWFFRPTDHVTDVLITKSAYNGEFNSYVSSSHCQEGSSRRIYTFSPEPNRGFYNLNEFLENSRHYL
jgi:hypothetical protein